MGAVDDAEQYYRTLLARIEERMDALGKRLDRLEDSITDQFAVAEQSMRFTINGRIKEVELKAAKVDGQNAIVRAVVFGMCGIVLTAFLGIVVAYFIGIPGRGIPTLPQPFTVQPK
jgi:uncharacterized membrane protein YqgA involved in biofilm formation